MVNGMKLQTLTLVFERFLIFKFNTVGYSPVMLICLFQI